MSYCVIVFLVDDIREGEMVSIWLLISRHPLDWNPMRRDKANVAPASIASCCVNKCLYILNRNRQNYSVLCMAKANGQHFTVSPFVSHLSRPYHTLYVAENGNLLLTE